MSAGVIRVSGVTLAVVAGVGFGLFQAFNRRANRGIDAYRATFGLLAVGTISLMIVAVATEDLGVLREAPLVSYVYLAVAGVVHFFLGLTLLALSQQRVGAARTGAAVAATPLVATVMASLALGEGLAAVTAAGVVLVVTGLAVMSLRGRGSEEARFRSIPWFGLGAAASWGTSPLFIRWGLEGLPVPLIGVTIGIAAAMVLYAVVLTATRRWKTGPLPRSNLLWLMAAGTLVAAAIVAQWTAYDLITIAVAITLMQVAAPVVILVAPVIVGTRMERITVPVVSGAFLIVAGSIVVVLAA